MQVYSPPPRPDFTRCFGITHMPGGAPIIREPKLLKVGIGVPKGVGIHVHRAEGVWKITVGTKRDNMRVTTAATRAEAEKIYWDLRKSAPQRQAPAKLPYFTFTRQAGDGVLVPDFDAIEAHGDTPTEIDIVFLSDQPLEASYAMWATAELRCKGDGIHGMRIITMAQGDEERALATEANARGEKFFAIVDGCATRGCRFTKGEPAPCKPSGDLKFQLANNLRVGGTAYFHTTGYRSISQLFSSLYMFRTLTGGGDPERGRIAGIPFKMCVRPYQSRHNGIIAQQYGVSLEFRAETVAALRHKLIEQATQFRTLISIPAPDAHRQLEVPEQAAPSALETAGEYIPVDDDLGGEEMQAAVMAQEFESVAAGAVEDESPEPETEQPASEIEPPAPPAPPAAAVAQRSLDRAASLKERLEASQSRKQNGGVAPPAALSQSAPGPTPAPATKRETKQEDFF